jgi:hypothetical protein
MHEHLGRFQVRRREHRRYRRDDVFLDHRQQRRRRGCGEQLVLEQFVRRHVRHPLRLRE